MTIWYNPDMDLIAEGFKHQGVWRFYFDIACLPFYFIGHPSKYNWIYIGEL